MPFPAQLLNLFKFLKLAYLSFAVALDFVLVLGCIAEGDGLTAESEPME